MIIDYHVGKNADKSVCYAFGRSVAILGRTFIWYNDIEEGFNRSKYTKYAEIVDYWCNQDELEWTIQQLLNEIKDGYPSGYYAGPPEPIA